MDDHVERSGAEPPRGISRHAAEIVVAVVLFALGALVVFDSLRLGASWGSDGPEAGYFPFYVGLIICISSAVLFVQALRNRTPARNAVFVETEALRRVLSVLVPAALFVLAIQLIGLYVAAALYIASFMAWLGRYSLSKSLLVGVLVSAVAFVTFEIWFQVPLYKGAFDPLWFLGY
jgi:putative tricarboxylic transport membrane protein